MKETCRHCGCDIFFDYRVLWRDSFGVLCPCSRDGHLPTANPSPGAPDLHKLLADALERIKELEAKK